jgi:ribonuclease Y
MLIMIVIVVIALLLGSVLGFLFFYMRANRMKLEGKKIKEKIIYEAEQKAKEIILDAKNEAFKITEASKREEQQRRQNIEKIESRLMAKEEALDQKTEKLDLVKTKLEEKSVELRQRKEELDALETKWKNELERIAQLSKEEAKEMLLKRYEDEFKDDIVLHIKKREEMLKEESDKKAKKIIAQAIQRYAAEVATESTATVVELPNDEMKGRIIGREGRNINAFEQKTGIDVIVDDTPGSILISGFDLMRRYIAKQALEELIKDGRIHPTRIEETVDKVTKEVNNLIKESGEKACFELGITGFHPDLIKLIGRLRFRTSYGQNVLKHSVEVGFLAAAIAGEMGADIDLAKKAGLLHDIGKAVDHEIEGSHAIIGGNIARKFGLPESLVNAIESHHDEVPAQTVEAIIAAAADAISGARPGARRESLEAYIKRLKELEALANSFEGVKKSFAIQAGREVRVIVEPEKIDDLMATKLAFNIARKIEGELSYPGEIKVSVIRELRVVDYAK